MADEASTTKMTVPPKRAKPSEVRNFLTQLLIQNRDFSASDADRIAKCWKNGTGTELRSYPAAMYFHIFGLEDGWILYKEVKLTLDKADPKWERRYLIPFLIAFSTLLSLPGIKLLQDEREDMKALGGACLGISTLVFIVTAGVLIVRQFPEWIIQQNLLQAVGSTSDSKTRKND